MMPPTTLSEEERFYQFSLGEDDVGSLKGWGGKRDKSKF